MKREMKKSEREEGGFKTKVGRRRKRGRNGKTNKRTHRRYGTVWRKLLV